MATLFSRTDENQFESNPRAILAQEAEVVPAETDPFTSHTRTFLNALQDSLIHKPHVGAESAIRVSEVFGIIALVYEKVRGAIEYKREHLVRRNAIERILRRLLWERQGRDVQVTAHLLLRELIWAHYLPNDQMPKSLITDVGRILQKYLDLINLLGGYNAVKIEHRVWILGVASCDVEEAVDPSFKRELFVDLMYHWFQTHFEWRDPTISEAEKNVQTYLSVHRSLPKSDEPIMRYHLLIKEYPSWKNPTKEEALHVAQSFSKLYTRIEHQLRHPIHLPMYRMMKRHAPPFEILQEVLRSTERDFIAFLKSTESLELKIREICQVRYTEIRQRVSRGIVRSVIYIFVTKVLLAFAIEFPYELFIIGHISILPISINVAVPPTLMFLTGLTIKTPDERNTVRLIERINNIVYQQFQGGKVPFRVGKPSERTFLTSAFSFIYLLLFGLVFGGISYMLYQIGFNMVSGSIFFIFLSLVLLFGFRVRSTASELLITGDREGIFGYLLNNLSLPFLNFGVILSQTVSKLNVFIIIMDFLIEAPLKTIIELIEEWTTFMRQKREEVIEVPPE